MVQFENSNKLWALSLQAKIDGRPLLVFFFTSANARETLTSINKTHTLCPNFEAH